MVSDMKTESSGFWVAGQDVWLRRRRKALEDPSARTRGKMSSMSAVVAMPSVVATRVGFGGPIKSSLMLDKYSTWG